MKRSLTLLLILASAFSFGQVDPAKIKEQAEQMASALLHGDYETMVKFTHPKVVELIGGRDKMISLLKNGTLEMQQQGISFESVIIGEPSSIVKAGEDLHCLIPQTIFMKVPKGKLKTESHLLAISKDKGIHWVFIDTVKLDKDNVKMVVPNYNPELQLPPKGEIQFIPD